jgi:membrane fusion protein, multidrug efflux system
MSRSLYPFKRRALASVATLLLLCASAFATEFPSTAARAVENEQVLEYSGIVEASRQTALEIEVAGRVTQLLVRSGDYVTRGQALLRVDSRTARDRVAAQDAEVEAANAALSVADSEFRRQKALYSEGSISESALERAEAEYQQSRASAKARLAAASAARTATNQHILSAPYDGRISEVITRLGALASPGLPLIRMYDPAELRVSLAVPEGDISALEGAASDQITIKVADSLTVSPVEQVLVPEIDPVGHSALMYLYLPGSIAVLPGAFANVEFRVVLPRALVSIRVPRRSVVNRSDIRAVYVISEGEAQLRVVRLGRVIGDEVEILAGLEPGERVALEPGQAVVAKYGK